MSLSANHRILLGGIGGDSHSVGLHILHRALEGSGYDVTFLGIQNTIADFVRRAPEFNVVMVSNLDGHAQQYLQGFTVPPPNGHRTLWYLGGNLTIGEGDGYPEYFQGRGFDRVYAKFVDLSEILGTLEEDLKGVEVCRPASPAETDLPEVVEAVAAKAAGSLSVRGRLPLDRFFAQRDAVLGVWPTGEVARDLQATAAYLREQPSLPALLRDVDAGRRPMAIQPRSGVPGLAEQIALFRTFRAHGATALSYQVDSLTRNNNYAAAAETIRQSEREGKALLNGFPVINHGVPGLRRVVEEIGLPIQTRHSTRDPRLLAEISYAGGVTAFEGGAICYNIPYYKDFTPSDSIAVWQYVDRLTGLLAEEHGIVLDREFFGTLTGTLIPPCIAIVTNILESALAAEQGVRCVSLAYAEQGHRAQDIAAIRVMASVGREILLRLGYENVAVHTVFHQYMAAFPPSERKAEELIFASAVTATLAGATRLITKTPAEARKIPTLDDNLRGLALARMGLAAAHNFTIDETAVAFEADILRREVLAIFDSLLAAGDGDLATGIGRGFERGLIEVPFAPSVHNRGEVMTARDVDGAVRFLRTGNLQFDSDLREFHEQKMAGRRSAEGDPSNRSDALLVEADVLQIAREEYESWPLDEPPSDLAID